MPRPQRKRIAPLAPTQLPESLRRAIQADKDAAKPRNPFTRRTTARAVSPEEYFMSGAKGVAPAESMQNIQIPPTLRKEETEVVPSSIQSEEARLSEMPSPVKPPSTVQRPIPQKTAMPSINWRTQATPKLESSMLGNFKRRPRQPSILGIGRQDDSSGISSLAGVEGDPFYDELEDFDPVAATPVAKTGTAVARLPTSAIPRLISSPASALTTNKRKRDAREDSPEVLVQRSSTITPEEANDLFSSSPPPAQDEQQEIELPVIKKPVITTSRNTSTSSLEIWSETMAPPQSSPSDVSAELEPVASPITTKRASRKKAISPAKKSAPRTRGQTSRTLQPISTAQLQNLLPVRRTKQKAKPNDSPDITNIDSSYEDEASFAPTKRTRGPTKKPKTPVKKTTSTRAKGKPALEDRTNTKTSISSTIRKGDKPSAIRPSTGRTYAARKRVASGQENDPFALAPSIVEQAAISVAEAEGQGEGLDVSNSSLADLDPKARTQLDAIVQKFKEVDDWEMEFEEMEENSSSSADLILG